MQEFDEAPQRRLMFFSQRTHQSLDSLSEPIVSFSRRTHEFAEKHAQSVTDNACMHACMHEKGEGGVYLYASKVRRGSGSSLIYIFKRPATSFTSALRFPKNDT